MHRSSNFEHDSLLSLLLPEVIRAEFYESLLLMTKNLYWNSGQNWHVQIRARQFTDEVMRIVFCWAAGSLRRFFSFQRFFSLVRQVLCWLHFTPHRFLSIFVHEERSLQNGIVCSLQFGMRIRCSRARTGKLEMSGCPLQEYCCPMMHNAHYFHGQIPIEDETMKQTWTFSRWSESNIFVE